MLKNNDFKQKIPMQLAFIVILGLGFLVVWIVVHTGEEIIYSARESPTFNFQKKLQQETTQKKSAKENKTEDGLISE